MTENQFRLASFAKWPASIPNIYSQLESEENAIDENVLFGALSSDSFWSNVAWYISLYQCKLCRFEGERMDMWRHVQETHINLDNKKAWVYIHRRFRFQLYKNTSLMKFTFFLSAV